VRTNCVDCLDRTGIAQHKICEKVLRELLPEIKTGELGPSWDADLTFLWAYGGDYISKEYSGTNSVLTKIVLQGYQTFADKVEQKKISCKRF
jgi:hypothetical protein